MKVKRFVAATSREALAQVKKDIGPDAVILSNRSTQGGVEILALSNKDVGFLTGATPRAANASPFAKPPTRPAPAAAGTPREIPLAGFARRIDAPTQKSPLEPRIVQKPVPAPGVAEQQHLYAELKAVRGLVEKHLATLSWSEEARRQPQRAQLMREMLAAGFSAPLGRKVSAGLPEGKDLPQARRWLHTVLAQNLHATRDPVERGGVFALVGPTGAGKTTTVAKIAARCVVRFGAQKVALISSDSYRIGAQDQLRIYARILGVPVHAVQDAEGLDHTLRSLADKHLVLIDTVGMGQRDPRLAEQMELLSDRRIRRLLLLNAACQVETLEQVANAYRGNGYAGAIVTKLDEAARTGAALDVAIRHRLPLAAVTDGQRVPEDIRLPEPARLVAQALAGAAESPFALDDDALSALPVSAPAVERLAA